MERVERAPNVRLDERGDCVCACVCAIHIKQCLKDECEQGEVFNQEPYFKLN